VARDWRHGQPSRKRPAATQTAPITAQNVLPVIDEPWMRLVPWPIQTTPVRQSKAPTTRRTTVTSGHYGRPRRVVWPVRRRSAAAVVRDPSDPASL